MDTTDGRLLRGDRARRSITRHAVDLASAEGLNGLSLGRIAADLGVSKSGVQTLFGSKERLQLATVSAAEDVFTEAVVGPALAASPPGLPRLRALLERWFDYAAEPLLPGGCFWTANLPDFDSRPGPVRDALAGQHRDWLALLAAEVEVAAGAGELVSPDPRVTALLLDAVLSATNVALRLEEADALARGRRAVDVLLAGP